VAFGLRARRMSAEAINARVNEALEMVRLGEYAQRLPRELSGGQQQRVALARALVMRPRVLLLDEPLSALDRHLRLAMQEELRRIHAETGLTFVHITHDQSEALALGDRVAVMRAGEFLQVDKPETLYRRPGHRFVAEFVGINNVFEAKVLSAGPAQLLVGEVVLRSNGRVAVAGDTAYLSIRPEALHVGNNPDAVNSFKARLTAVAFAGAAIEMILHTGTQQWIAHVAARSRASGFEVGSEIDLSVDPEDVVVIPRDA
jgi:putative spermidine/putrescine transport system ATP-binding protein/spermidine/putrescine transport system ATP-binding protein